MPGSQVQQDQANEISVVESVRPAVINATVSGQSINLGSPLFRSVTLVVNVGTVTDGTHLFTLEESDTGVFGGEQNTVAAADLIGAFPANLTTNTPVKVGYAGVKQFLRAKTTVTPGATGAAYGATFIKGRPASKPTPNP